MSTPPEKADEVRQWLTKAERDLLVADRAVHQPPLLDIAVYHAQQAAEKALKDFLTWHDQPFRRTYDLVELARQCAAYEPAFTNLHASAALLTSYAVAFRYPGDLLEPGQADTDTALQVARDILVFVRLRLPTDVQP